MRSGVDRRLANHGPPEGVPERRQNDRRSHDRRSHQRVDRRSRDRRLSTGRRGSASGPRHLTRAAQPRAHVAPVVAKRSRTAKLFRGLVITLVALACLLAATLTESPGSNGSASSLSDRAVNVLHLGESP
ncbi:MAG: hypothetical protein Q7T55_05555 [Solirubrobacteraceae bacterium]|nr:hypothetical protein [Solirubrobacteraceae bacterium]